MNFRVDSVTIKVEKKKEKKNEDFSPAIRGLLYRVELALQPLVGLQFPLQLLEPLGQIPGEDVGLLRLGLLGRHPLGPRYDGLVASRVPVYLGRALNLLVLLLVLPTVRSFCHRRAVPVLGEGERGVSFFLGNQEDGFRKNARALEKKEDR